MQIDVICGSVTEVLCDALIVNIFEGVIMPGGAAGVIDKALAGHISEIIRDQPDCGKYGEITIIHTRQSIGAKNVILLGLGKKAELTLNKICSLSAIAARAAKKLRVQTVASIVHGAGKGQHEPKFAVQALVEGTILGIYRFDYYKTEKKDLPTIDKFIIIENDIDKIGIFKDQAGKAQIIAESVNFTRDLVNHPAEHMTPTQLAWHASDIAQQTGIEISIFDKRDMEEYQMNALLAVAKGSDKPPKMIVLKYIGDAKQKQFTAFIGKGITFDSGGISLKPSENMGDMKGDMAGGAAVLGAMLAIGQLKPAANIVAIIPCAENMPSGHALKPGDVIFTMNGKSVEIISTDAEGRLILADAITYALKLGATQLIDLATLTGACVVALGTITSGVISNNDDLCCRLLKAAAQSGEKMWEMPNFEEYNELIKSNIADLKNSGGRWGGMITAGLFLNHFTDKTPWVHIDIAGTSDIDKDSGYNIQGATGAGVRTLIQFAQNLNKI